MHVVADPRFVRRVLKRQRGLTAFGGAVPHGHCCVVSRTALLDVVSASELGAVEADLPAVVILVARPDSDDVREVWRRAFHGHVHRHLEDRARAGELTLAAVRDRIHRIGQTEFDEIRAVLRGEDLLFVAGDDREAYIEFAAFYLELLLFDAEHVASFFPTLRDPERARATLALDLDAAVLLERCRPTARPDLTPGKPKLASLVPARLPARASRPSLVDDGDAAGGKPARPAPSARGNVVRVLLRKLRNAEDAGSEVEQLARRVRAALKADASADADAVGAGERDGAPSLDDWRDVIWPLAEIAARSTSLRVLEARVLHDLQKACVDAERQRNAVDVVTWVTSLFQRPIVRPLPVVGVVRIARHVQRAFDRSHHSEAIAKDDRATLERVFRAALARAKENVRAALVPALEGVLTEVGLGPRSVPEVVAREKLSEEILDLVLASGSLGLSHLRDALSRSNLKMQNLTPAAVLTGDAILRADRRLAVALDGIYRRGEIYLRFLQKVSSVAFGTRPGRFLTLHLALPLLLSFVLLEALQHLAHPIGRALGHAHVTLLSAPSFAGVALFFYGLVHSEAVQRVARALARAVGGVLHAVFVDVPAFVLSSAPVKALLGTRALSLVLEPALIGGVVYLTLRHFEVEETTSLATGGVLLGATAMFLGTRLGMRVEEAFTDRVVRHVRELSRRALPGLLALVLEIFRVLIERVERAIYTVDEWLTFKQGQSSLSLVAKGALGIVWFFVTYLLRIYVNVLIEPQVNPIKHFPVVTVSHKIVLPMSPTILAALRPPLAPLGQAAANAIAGSTVLLLPGVFGFLVWELKENWKLYDQNRSKRLEPLHIGHHGETMNGLLVMGFHQGTIPKLYARMRRSARRGEAKVNAYRQKLHEVEHALETFAMRELVGLLRHAKRWNEGDLEVHAVEMASNRIRIAVGCAAVSSALAWLQLEEQSGLLVASVPTTGFLDVLSDEAHATFETALAGFYKRAGVDVVREQLEAELGDKTPYDIAKAGVVVWPGEGYETEVTYALSGAGPSEGVVSGKPLREAPRPLDLGRALFSRQEISWAAWVTAFGDDVLPAGRIFRGPPLLVRDRGAPAARATSSA